MEDSRELGLFGFFLHLLVEFLLPLLLHFAKHCFLLLEYFVLLQERERLLVASPRTLEVTRGGVPVGLAGGLDLLLLDPVVRVSALKTAPADGV